MKMTAKMATFDIRLPLNSKSFFYHRPGFDEGDIAIYPLDHHFAVCFPQTLPLETPRFRRPACDQFVLLPVERECDATGLHANVVWLDCFDYACNVTLKAISRIILRVAGWNSRRALNEPPCASSSRRPYKHN